LFVYTASGFDWTSELPTSGPPDLCLRSATDFEHLNYAPPSEHRIIFLAIW